MNRKYFKIKYELKNNQLKKIDKEKLIKIFFFEDEK